MVQMEIFGEYMERLRGFRGMSWRLKEMVQLLVQRRNHTISCDNVKQVQKSAGLMSLQEPQLDLNVLFIYLFHSCTKLHP